ncbi:MSHA biogenesis protein MshI [Vibrio sp. ZSDE26]|uniref:MSHA biogenesis protein MshI n=1 Tax=Vibrio amylolyticus TaxID=2847292 RepID=A0A9X1XFX1_9VIBR|nr:MSHA biogenesis protein MshI [Vibrio amylolyticus]MCK6262257.1 MSHA biogenesis protein MshI [Vibrio amylolyticus]
MKIKSLIDKLKPTKNEHSNLLVIVQPDAIYFSQHPAFSIPKAVLENSSWQQTLAANLKKYSVEGITVSVILDSSLYQTYQLETPNIPQNEWSVALPFLLKDLVTEKVTDIVADAFRLPSSNKIQAYVINRTLISDLTLLLSKHNCQLGELLTEDDVWGSTASELKSYLLLQRSARGSYKIGAFHEGRCVFQRTIRNVAAPLTGTASSALQLDGMALELQRSIDYLSSQLKGIPLHTLFTCCDEEQQQELAQALDERLNVKVKPLAEELSSDGEPQVPDELLISGEILAIAANTLSADRVNLYPAHLKPKKQYFTFKNVAISWLTVASILLALSGFYHYRSGNLQVELTAERQQSKSLSQQTAKLKKELESHTPSPDKVAAVARLKLEIQTHRDSLKAIGDYDQSQRQGYSGVMVSLATLGRKDISLEKIQIDSHKLNLHGLARNAEAVPNWVHQFRQELNLVGRTFEKLKIGRNDQNIITFELMTQGDVER